MYRLSPYTYLIEGLLGQAIGNQEINCSAVEFVTLEPPSGLTCQDYMGAFTSVAGGYITNPEATSSCNFCAFRTTDQFLGLTFNIFYHHRWRDVGIVAAFIVFNVRLSFFISSAWTSVLTFCSLDFPRLRDDLPIPHSYWKPLAFAQTQEKLDVLIVLEHE